MSTYIDALPPLVSERTGRIHPRFHQLGAATGRMSASHPNVQNIPIRGDEGVRIREAFVPAEGCKLAIDEYFDSQGDRPFIHRIDSTGRLVVKMPPAGRDPAQGKRERVTAQS